MPKLLFVHGTGVRLEGYQQTLGIIAKKVGSHAEVIPCYWGDLGSCLNAAGKSIPNYDSTRSITDLETDALDQDAYQIELWRTLLSDPLHELSTLALMKPRTKALPWEETEGAKLIQVARQLELSVRLKELLLEGGVDPVVFEQAMRAVTSSLPFQEALEDADENLAAHRAAIARAWIATAARLTQEVTLKQTGEWTWPALLLDDELRSQLESLLVDALGGKERGIVGWAIQRLSRSRRLRLWLTQEVANRRKAISDAAYPAAGDIVLYQARGEAIRNRIQERIRAADGPVHVLAHSLGGVACVELLAMQTLPVQQLITVGSQAPLLYEINALRCLPFGDPLPNSLPPWLNIYDLKDFLSYVGGDLFPGRVVDHRVDNRQAFPASHSAYWYNPMVWEAILPTLRH
jgi:hypothetical protein